MIKKIIQRIIGLLIIMIGLGGALQNSLVTAILFFITGALILPGVFAFIQNKTSSNIKYRQKFIIVGGLFMAGCIFIQNPGNSAESKNKEIKKKQPNVVETKKDKIISKKGDNEVSSDIVYEIVDKNIQDNPLKVQIIYHIGLSGFFDKNDVKKILDLAYEEAKIKTGFKNQKHASHYFIMVYTDNDRAKEKNGNWVGMLTKINNSNIEYRFNEIIINNSQQKESEKFGIKEMDRKNIFKQIILAERKATSIAESKYDFGKMTGSAQEKTSIFGRARQESEDLLMKEILQKNNLTKKQLSEISLEGINKGRNYP